MSKYNSTLKYVASTPRSQRKGKGARYYGSTIPSLPSAGGVSLSYVEANFVTLNTEQAISGIKDFTKGLKVGGLSVYKSQADTIYLDANLVVRGGITAFGTNETITPSIFEALPIDGATLKRTENGVLYVDTTVVGGGGTGGGISIADVENYLTTNGYATQSWVTGRGYITGITGAMVTNALGYAPLNKTGDVLTLKANQYTGAYALDMQNSNIVNLNALFTSDVANDPTEGIQFKRTNGNFDSLWAADGIMYFSPNGNNAEMTGEYATSYAVLHAGNYGSYPIRNPNALSWSGYSSGSYDGSTAQSITIPNNTNQLVNGAGFITASASITGNAATSDRLVEEVVTDLNNATAGRIFTMTSGYGSTAGNKPVDGWVTGLTLQFAQSGSYRRQLAFCYDLYFRTEDNTNWGAWRKILDDSNYSYYALPLTGGKINGDLELAGYLYPSDENLKIRAKGASLVGIEIAISATDYWQISHRGSFANNELHFYHNANGTWSNSVLSLIGDGSVTVGNNLLAKGGITAQNSSDRRLKKNIRKFNASKTLMSLGAVWEYEYIDSEVAKNSIYAGTHYGLIYQHVKGTALDVMCHKREDGYGTLNYIHPKFISLITGATMENISEVEKLKREIRHLKNKVKQLENRA